MRKSSCWQDASSEISPKGAWCLTRQPRSDQARTVQLAELVMQAQDGEAIADGGVGARVLSTLAGDDALCEPVVSIMSIAAPHPPTQSLRLPADAAPAAAPLGLRVVGDPEARPDELGREIQRRPLEKSERGRVNDNWKDVVRRGEGTE